MAPLTETNTSDVLAVRILASNLRPVYQVGLLVWYRDANNKVALSRLLNVMVQLQQVSPDEGLWCSAAEVIEKLLEGKLACSTSIKLLLGQVERQIRRVMDAGPEALFSNPPIDLIKNLLHCITVSESHTASNLDSSCSHQDLSLTNSAGEVKSTFLDMATQTIKHELIWAKKKLEDFSRSDSRHTSDELRTIMDVLRQISSSTHMLGCWESRQIVRKQTGILESMLEGESIVNDARILEVANALLYAESLLGNKKPPAKPVVKLLQSDSQPVGEEEFHELCRAIIRQVIVDLTQVKDAIASFSREPGQTDLLIPIPGLLHRIIGALTMLSLHRPCIVLKVISLYINHELLAVKIVPTLAALNTLEDALTSVEYFLETMVESQMNLDSLLDMAECNIKALGYLVDNINDRVIQCDRSELAFPEQDIPIPLDMSSMHGKAFLGEKIVVVDISADVEPSAVL